MRAEADPTYAGAIAEALAELLEADPKVLLLGEDIRDPYGGAFKVTKGLSTRFPGRVLNTPISEAAMTGLATGLALGGWRPVLEIMFADFLTLAADQLINHAAKFTWMYGDGVGVPLVVRTPSGGYRGYGPTHSQCLERLFFGVPGLRVAAPTHLHRPGEALKEAVAGAGPVLFVENKACYSRKLGALAHPGRSVLAVSRLGMDQCSSLLVGQGPPDVTLLCYGGIVGLAEAAALDILAREELVTEIIVPLTIQPFDPGCCLASLCETRRLVVLEEGPQAFGWGAEAVASLSGLCQLDAPARRVGAADVPIGSARQLELGCLPSAQDIVQALLDVCE